MDLLLCAATAFEILPTVEFINAKKLPVTVLITGVGVPVSIYTIAKKIWGMNPDFVLQAGIAGSLNPSLQMGEVVVVETDVFGDVGVQQNKAFQSVFKMGFANENTFPFVDGCLVNGFQHPPPSGLQRARGVTVNEITTSPERIDYYRHHLKADIETMEGAALHYVCLMEGLSFLQLRSVSNRVGERNKANWEVQKAVSNLNRELHNIIANFYCV